MISLCRLIAIWNPSRCRLEKKNVNRARSPRTCFRKDSTAVAVKQRDNFPNFHVDLHILGAYFQSHLANTKIFEDSTRISRFIKSKKDLCCFVAGIFGGEHRLTSKIIRLLQCIYSHCMRGHTGKKHRHCITRQDQQPGAPVVAP